MPHSTGVGAPPAAARHSVVLHCKGGLGAGHRGAAAGEFGMGGEEAIALVRRLRPARPPPRRSACCGRGPSPCPEYPARVAVGGAIGNSSAPASSSSRWRVSVAASAPAAPPLRARLRPAGGDRRRHADDTVCTAEGLIRAVVDERVRGAVHTTSMVWHAYHRWLLTQGDCASGWRSSTSAPMTSMRSRAGWSASVGPGPGNTSSPRCAAAAVAARRAHRRRRGLRRRDAGGAGRLLLARHADPFALGADVAAIAHGTRAASSPPACSPTSLRGWWRAPRSAMRSPPRASRSTAQGEEAAETRDALGRRGAPRLRRAAHSRARRAARRRLGGRGGAGDRRLLRAARRALGRGGRRRRRLLRPAPPPRRRPLRATATALARSPATSSARASSTRCRSAGSASGLRDRAPCRRPRARGARGGRRRRRLAAPNPGLVRCRKGAGASSPTSGAPRGVSCRACTVPPGPV